MNLSYQTELPLSVMFAMVINSSIHNPQMKPRGKITLLWIFPMVDSYCRLMNLRKILSYVLRSTYPPLRSKFSLRYYTTNPNFYIETTRLNFTSLPILYNRLTDNLVDYLILHPFGDTVYPQKSIPYC